jgi:glycopeptide antibiotics resistance protein
MQRKYKIAFIAYTAVIYFLTIVPFRYRPPAMHHLPWPIGPSYFELPDFCANIVLFVPFGFLLHFILSKKKYYDSVCKAIFIGCGMSLSIETLQIIILARFPSFTDLFSNTLGSGMGACVGLFVERKNLISYYIPYQKKIVLGGFFLYAAFLFSLPFISQEPIALWRNNGRVLIGNNMEQMRPWKGHLISVAVYDKILLNAQIQRHFQNGYNMPTENPILKYRFDQQGKKGRVFTGADFLSSRKDGVQLYDRIKDSAQFAVEAWFYPSRQFDAGGRIISFANIQHDFFYLRQSKDEMTFAIEGNALKKVRVDWEGVEEIFREEHWPVHIVGNYDGGALTLYFNGKEVEKRQMGNGFFILSEKLNFERMDFGHALLLLGLFGVFGYLSAMIFQNNSTRVRVLKAVTGLFFVTLIIVIEGRQNPSFFTPRVIWVPAMAFFVGFGAGECLRMKSQNCL